MANITLYLPDELKRRAEKQTHIRWSAVVRSIIERTLDDLEEADRLAQESGLTEEDVEELSRKVKKGMGKRAEAMLGAARS